MVRNLQASTRSAKSLSPFVDCIVLRTNPAGMIKGSELADTTIISVTLNPYETLNLSPG